MTVNVPTSRVLSGLYHSSSDRALIQLPGSALCPKRPKLLLTAPLPMQLSKHPEAKQKQDREEPASFLPRC